MTNFEFGTEKRLSRLTLARAEKLNALFAEIAAMSETKISFTIDGDIDADGGKVINAADGTDPQDLVTKRQLDATAFAPALPGQTGNAGRFITTDGTNASWVDAPVRFDIGQLLTAPQQAQARANIAAAGSAETATALAAKADATATAAALATKAEAADVALALAQRVRFDAVQSMTLQERGQARANIGAKVLAGFRDKMINGNGAINQRAPVTVADDTYWCDRHYALTQTAAITPSILSDVANGLPSMMRLTQSQATAQRMGNAQIFEAAISKPLRGLSVTLGGRTRSSIAQTIRYAVLEWTGTADAVTSDVVNNWTATVFTPGNFFLASNLVLAAAGSVALSANAITNWSVVAPISGACNNIIVLYWTDAAVAQNVTLDMAWGLVEGDASAEVYPYELRSPPQELLLCQRYFYRATTLVAPSSNFVVTCPRKVTMRVAPSYSGGGAGFVANNNTAESAWLGQTFQAAQTLSLDAEL
jgi:hypothetical protein